MNKTINLLKLFLYVKITVMKLNFPSMVNSMYTTNPVLGIRKVCFGRYLHQLSPCGAHELADFFLGKSLILQKLWSAPKLLSLCQVR